MHILDEREDRDWLEVVEVGGERASSDRSATNSHHGPWETYLEVGTGSVENLLSGKKGRRRVQRGEA